MSTLEKTIKTPTVELPPLTKTKESILSQFIGVLCSVRLGVILLILLGSACLIGMLVRQQSVEGFAQYYAELTPLQKLIYGSLDFFDIYHAWYFNALLALLSLNIIMASVDRFPKTYRYISNPNLTVPLRWLRAQKSSAAIDLSGGADKKEIIEKITHGLKKVGWKKTHVTERRDRTFVFAQSGVWNRFGAYAVHIALLTIFFGGFLTAQFSQTGQMPLSPGQTSNQIFDTVVRLDEVSQIARRLPFEIICTDIQQKLIKDEGSIGVGNTIDWLTRIRIKDGNETTEAVVQINRPFDYRGYRFFQAGSIPVGRARSIKLEIASAASGEILEMTLPRDGKSALPDGTLLKFIDFRGNFSLGRENPNEDSGNYPNPTAVLQITPPGQNPQTAYAFGPQLGDIPLADKAVGGYTFKLLNFEKVGDRHILAVQRDPGADVVYIGFTLLFLTLVSVFFFSHRRVWAAVEKNSANGFTVTLGGHSNRNQQAFDDKFKRLVKDLRSF